jgi:uncharacterized protein YozE (UPF0346 family)
MNDDNATHHVRDAINLAIRAYHDKKAPKDATHLNQLGTYYKKEFGVWYYKSPFDKHWHATTFSSDYAAMLIPIKHFTQSTV